jgi:cyanophycinase
VDSYLNTRAQKELNNMLARGGVIGGSSAGATIQGSYLVRGAKEGNTVMMAPGYEKGLGFLRDSAVDQHVITRHRESDLDQVIAKYPKLLGIGLDESTAIVVQRDQFDVLGKSKVFIHTSKYKPGADGKKYFLLTSGDHFDLKKRKKIDG